VEGRLFAIGDIHGCFGELKQLVESEAAINHNDKVVFLGDYIDRGENSREVVDYIIDMRNSGLDIVTLRGNHEEMLIGAYEDKNRLYQWFLNGGYTTLDSFGAGSVNDLADEYVDFFYSLKYYYCLGNFVFVHAGFNDDIEDPFEDTVEMVWTRRGKYRNPVLKGFTIIHGHTPVPIGICREMINEHASVINIDTGCVYSDVPELGHLSAVELYSMKHYSV